MHRRYLAGEAIANGFRFAFIRDGANNCLRLQNLADRHREGLRRHLVKARKPAFAYLLKPTRLIQCDDNIGRVGFKVGRRIVESEVPVFADADECHVNRVLRDNLVKPFAFGLRIVGFTVEEMHCPRMHDIHKPLLQILAETGRMRLWNPDVFVQVEHRRLVPVNGGIRSERGEEIELRCPRRDDEIRVSVGADCFLQFRAGGVCCGCAGFTFGCRFKNLHNTFRRRVLIFRAFSRLR